MFYFGESELPGRTPGVSHEVLYKPYLIQHIIIGLGILQHQGNLVLKVHEIDSPFTAGAIFILYNLFQKVLIFKPFAVSPLSSAQFVVCKSLNDL